MPFSSVNEAPRFRLTEWLSGSGEADKTPLPLSRTSGKLGVYPQRQSRCPLEPVLGGVMVFYEFPYSLRSSSSGVGLWKNAIHGFIVSSGMWKLSCESFEFLSASRRINSSSDTSRKCTSLLAPSCFALNRKSSRSSRAQKPKSRITFVPNASALLAMFQSMVSIRVCLTSCSGSSAS
jgi:hypothetical protein